MPNPELMCPDCDSDRHKVVELARVGPTDDFGIVCGSCNKVLAEMRLSDVYDGVEISHDV